MRCCTRTQKHLQADSAELSSPEENEYLVELLTRIKSTVRIIYNIAFSSYKKDFEFTAEIVLEIFSLRWF